MAPYSTAEFPKQFLPIFENQSSFQLCVERAKACVDLDHIIIVTQDKYKELIQTQLGSDANRIIVLGEPCKKNTLPAISLGVFGVQATAQTVFSVFPSDHFIQNVSDFCNNWKKAHQLAQKGSFVLFGIKPTHPSSDYGYLQVEQSSEVLSLLSFTEKPDFTQAQSYLQQQNYYWNSGIFVFNRHGFVQALQTHQTSLYQAFCKLDSLNYQEIQAVSIDYGLMEHLKPSQVQCVPADFDWIDIGSLHSYLNLIEKIESQFEQQQ